MVLFVIDTVVPVGCRGASSSSSPLSSSAASGLSRRARRILIRHSAVHIHGAVLVAAPARRDQFLADSSSSASTASLSSPRARNRATRPRAWFHASVAISPTKAVAPDAASAVNSASAADPPLPHPSPYGHVERRWCNRRRATG
ncbi:hypothetical protein SMICM304S_03096 [Streptomyces microflavus]